MINILELVKNRKPNIKLAIIGGGSKQIEDKFFKLVKQRNLQNNIRFFGYITSDKKFEILSKSKIFLFPSYYESFGQVVLEAMKCGLPVIAYDLPPFAVFKQGMIKIPVLNNEQMSKEIFRLLDDSNYYKEIRTEAINFSANFSWEKTGEEIFNIINS